jgi:hypothetical protein
VRRKTYRPEVIKEIVEYAQLRGVRVMPELDAPAHVGNGWQFGEMEGMGRLALCVNQERGLAPHLLKNESSGQEKKTRRTIVFTECVAPTKNRFCPPLPPT